jgi:hypothetical protein
MQSIRAPFLAALTIALAVPAYAQTGNGAPSGRHYNLNIIGVDKGKTSDLAGSNRHTIFVWLGKNGTVSSKIYLTPGEDFRVCDGNATDGVAYGCDGVPLSRLSGAVFQLPCNTNLQAGTDPDGEPSTLLACEAEDPQLAYEVYARALGGPGGSAKMTTCATETVDVDNDGTLDVECSTENVVFVRNPGKSTFTNVTQQLTSLVVCYDTNPDPTVEDIDCFRYALFRDEFEDWYWDYANSGLRLAQIRFYPIE